MDPVFKNSALSELRRQILSSSQDSSMCFALVCRNKEVMKKLKDWMINDQELRGLRPCYDPANCELLELFNSIKHVA